MLPFKRGDIIEHSDGSVYIIECVKGTLVHVIAICETDPKFVAYPRLVFGKASLRNCKLRGHANVD